MKLTAAQLRKIIAEETEKALYLESQFVDGEDQIDGPVDWIQKRSLKEIESKKALREGGTDSNWNSVVDAAVTAFYDAAPPYDRNDPSMRANGPTGWSEQLEGAAEDFRNEVGVVLDKIVEKLHKGDYFI